MKKLLKIKIFSVPLVLVVAVAVFGGAVYAATTLTLPGQVNIVAATCDIKIYSDPECNFEITKIIWDDLPVGGERTKTVYVKNTGNTDAKVTAVLQSPPAGVAFKLGTNSILVNSGAQVGFTLFLEATQAAQIASAAFTVNFASAPVYVNY